MKDILKRDITGECVGECRNTVREAEEKRQKKIEAMAFEASDTRPSVAKAFTRNEPPGFLGGHI